MKDSKSPANNMGFRHIAGLFLLAFALIFIIRLFVMGIFIIPSSSMENALHKNDIVVLSKIYYFFGFPYYLDEDANYRYWYKEPKKNDIIAFRYEKELLVKRIISVPGETVILPGEKNKSFFLNPRPIILPEKGILLHLSNNTFKSYRKLIIKEGNSLVKVNDKFILNGKAVKHYRFKYSHYYVLGDNRENSSDSREFGTVLSRDIIGAPILKIFGKAAPKFLN
jgi:signal peptidase I